MGYDHISKLTTAKFIASVVRTTVHRYKVTCVRALVSSDRGYGPTAVLRQIISISRFFSRSVLHSLIVSMVLSRLDYGGAKLARLPARLVEGLQSFLNSIRRSWSWDHASMTTWLHLYINCIGFVFRNVSRFCSPLSARNCAAVPCWWTSTRGWRDVDTRQRLCDEQWLQHWFSHAVLCIVFCRCSSDEQSSTAGDVIAVTDDLSATFED